MVEPEPEQNFDKRKCGKCRSRGNGSRIYPCAVCINNDMRPYVTSYYYPEEKNKKNKIGKCNEK